MKWNIGNVEIKNQVVLAPMAGVSNPTYMKICEDMGVGYVVTELISAEAISRNNQKTLEMLKEIENLKVPVAIQIFGSNPEVMANAAKIINELYPKAIIDINMGCPVPKVALKNEAGSALLKNPDRIEKIVSAVVAAVNVPVTVKIRSGWDDSSINACEVAKIIERAGAKAIAIHARTRTQGYSGKANWQIIKDVVGSVKIPVIGNGDILSCYDAKRMLDETGCIAVMIGRGVMGNPWLIRECVNYLESGEEPKNIMCDERINMMEYHLQELIKDKCEKQAVLEMRGHILNYLKGLPENKEIKKQICECKTSTEILNVLEKYRNKLKNDLVGGN